MSSPSPPFLSSIRRNPLSAGRRQIRRTFDTVSVRMIAIILLAAIPLALLSAIVSWRNYESASGYSAARAATLVAIFRSRAQQDLAQSEMFLHDVAALGELRAPASCDQALHLALLAEAPRYRSLAVTDAAGQVVCGSAPAALPAGRLAGHPGIRGVSMQADPPQGPALIAELVSPILHDPRHFLVAGLRLGWRRDDIFGHDGEAGILDRGMPMQAWLLGPSGEVSPLCLDCGWTMPEDLRAIQQAAAASPGAAVATDSGSAAFGPMIAPVDVLTLTRTTASEAHALRVFIVRVIGIVLLLGLGLVAVSVGANLLVVAPLHRLTRAVTQWRRAGGYAPESTRLMPVELRELSHAFTQATRSLAAHEERLRAAERNQELLIKEIHHRVKNNLQIVASLLNLQANRIRAPEARAEFASARDRVRALATLHRYLYSEGDLQTLNMRSFLQELCAQLFQAIGEREGRRIQLHIEAPEIAMAADQAVPLALIVTETVSNAVKYAFPGGRAGHIHVSLSQLGRQEGGGEGGGEGGAMGRLVIRDDGVGIPDGRAQTESGVRDGLGIQLIRGFARQLGATLSVHEGEASESEASGCDASGGTCYSLTFPLHPRQPEPSTEDEPDGDRSEAGDGGG